MAATLVFARQVFLVKFGGVPNWNQGGFGMFSSIDQGAPTRKLSVELRLGDGVLQVPPPRELMSSANKLLNTSALGDAKDYAAQMANLLVQDPGKLSALQAGVWVTDIESIQLTIHRMHYAEGALAWRQLKQFEVQLATYE